MTLEDLIAVQQGASLGNLHLVWVGPHGFLVAHTDYERDSKIPLRLCRLHQWMEDRAGPPAPEGAYVVVANNSGGYDFQPIDLPLISGNGSSQT